MIRRSVVTALVVAFTAAALLVAPPIVTPRLAATAAAACPAVELIFARGRLEPAGAGQIGNALASALRSRGKNVNLYAVRYPADNQIDVGANDMSARVQSTMAGCPDTRIVVGGYSLGAAVTDVLLAVPFQFFGFNNPLPPGADQHIAAVALFGNGSAWAGPLGAVSPLYRERTIDLCHGVDPICNPADPNTWEKNWSDHAAKAYIDAGMVNQAADFIAGRV